MKTILINSPLFREENSLYDEDSLPPIGLGYIATNLRNNGIDVSLIDAVDQRIPFDELLNRLCEKKPSFIATNIFTTNYDIVKDLVERIPFSTHFIIGGLATKELQPDIFKWETSNTIDVVTGDGELITTAIVKDTIEQKPFMADIGRRAFKVDLSSPYLVKDISSIPLDRTFFKNEPVQHALGFIEANIITSRGCIYNCTFCAAARNLNKDYPVREKTTDSIKDELTEISRAFPNVTSIRVLDDLFLKNPKCVERAINTFSEFDFQWRSMAHVMTFNSAGKETMESLAASGCNELFIGIESGSPKILSSIKKTPNREKILENLSGIFRAGIGVKGYFIYGFPDETEEDMELTFTLAENIRNIAKEYNTSFRTSVFQYRPYHGTEIYETLHMDQKELKTKRINPNHELCDLVGRLQFNFHSGNYSEVNAPKVHDYICRTTNLNDPGIFTNRSTKSNTIRA